MCQEDARDTSKEHLRTGFNLRLIHSIHGLSDRVWKSLRIKVSEQIFCLNHWVSTEIQTQDIQDKSKNSNSKEISTTAYGEEYRIYNLGPRYENISTQQLQREKKKKKNSELLYYLKFPVFNQKLLNMQTNKSMTHTLLKISQTEIDFQARSTFRK